MGALHGLIDRHRRDLLAAGALTVLGILVRAGHLVAPHIDSDQAVFGLQAMHVLKGEFPVFSWGYAYIGTLQTYLVAACFFVFGPSRQALNGVVLLFYAGYSLSLYALAAAFFTERRWRVLVTALGAVAPGYFVLHGVWARHGYPETYFFGTLLLALACNHLGRQERARFYAALFFVAGLAWWSNFLILYYLPPIGLYLLFQLSRAPSGKSRARIVLASAAGFFAGSLPFWVFNAQNSFASFSMFRGTPGGRWNLHQVLGAFAEAFPVLVGAREQREGWTVPFLGPLLVALCVAALGFFVARRAARFPRALALRRLEPGDLLFAFFCSLVLFFAFSSQGAKAGTGSVRYLIPFYSLYPVAVVSFLAALERRTGRLAPAIALAAFVLAMNAASAWAWNPLFHRDIRERYRAEMDAERRLVADLERAGRRNVLTSNYWKAYRLTFDARERVIVDHVNSRHPGYLFDMYSGSDLSYLAGRRTAPLEEGFRLLGFSATRLPLHSAVLYTDFLPTRAPDSAAIPPRQYRLTLADAGVPAEALGDRDLATQLRVNIPRPGADSSLDAVFPDPVALSGLAVFLGNRYFAPLGVRVTDLDSGRVLVESGAALFGYVSGAYPYLPAAPPFLEIFFPPATTRRLRVSFLGTTRGTGFPLAEIVFFSPGERAALSDEELFERLRSQPDFDAVFSGMAAVRPLEGVLGRKVAFGRDRSFTPGGRTLFVFEKEYLAHNLEVLQALGSATESSVGRTFATIVARGGGGEARWLEKALFRAPARSPQEKGRP